MAGEMRVALERVIIDYWTMDDMINDYYYDTGHEKVMVIMYFSWCKLLMKIPAKYK